MSESRTRGQPTALLIQRGEELQALFPDDPGVTDAIRKAIGATLPRKPSRVVDYRTWSVDPAAFDAIARVLKGHGYRVEAYSQKASASQQKMPPSGAGSLTDRAVLGVNEAAPWPVVEAAYRALAKMYHPDATRNTANLERMKQINLAYERLQREARR